MHINRLLLLSIFCLILNTSFSQVQVYPLNTDITNDIDRFLLQKRRENINTSFRPYCKKDMDLIADSVYRYGYRDSVFISRRAHKWFWKKLRKESFMQVDSAKYTIKIDPYFDFGLSKGLKQDSGKYMVNSRGIIIHGTVGKNFNFNTAYVENQATFPDYISNYVKTTKVVPGQGFAKDFKTNGYDYGYASGYFDYAPSEYLDVRFGHGKNFIGDGYRSLLLSDYSYNYPYLMLSSKLWKFQYINLYSCYLDLNSAHTYEAGFTKKYSSTHYLIYRPQKSVSIGLFESVIWQARDSTSTRGFDVNYLNPLIFYHSVQYNLGSPDNSLLGLNLDWKFLNGYLLYGQFILDDFNVSKLKTPGFFQQKYGFQTGIKAVNFCTIKNLDLQVEYNQVQPYVYGHKDPVQNYSNYGEPLAHPLGANFQEAVSILRYKYRDFYINCQLNYAFYGADTTGSHWGKDIFKSDYDASRPGHEFSSGNTLAQGVRTTLWYKMITLGYIINPVTNMVIEAGVQQRTETSFLAKTNNTYIFVAFRTKLFNHYYDF